MKRSLIIFALVLVTIMVPSSVGAALSTSSATGSAQTSLKAQAEVRKTQVKKAATEKVKNSLVVRYNVYLKVLAKEQTMLDKIQIRIDAAKAAGKDVTAAEAAMTQAQSKLADAKSLLAQVNEEKGTAVSKADFTKIHRQMLAIGKDLNAVRLQIARAVSTVKSFNSVKASRSSEKEPTSSATVKDSD